MLVRVFMLLLLLMRQGSGVRRGAGIHRGVSVALAMEGGTKLMWPAQILDNESTIEDGQQNVTFSVQAGRAVAESASAGFAAMAQLAEEVTETKALAKPPTTGPMTMKAASDRPNLQDECTETPGTRYMDQDSLKLGMEVRYALRLWKDSDGVCNINLLNRRLNSKLNLDTDGCKLELTIPPEDSRFLAELAYIQHCVIPGSELVILANSIFDLFGITATLSDASSIALGHDEVDIQELRFLFGQQPYFYKFGYVTDDDWKEYYDKFTAIVLEGQKLEKLETQDVLLALSDPDFEKRYESTRQWRQVDTARCDGGALPNFFLEAYSEICAKCKEDKESGCCVQQVALLEAFQFEMKRKMGNPNYDLLQDLYTKAASNGIRHPVTSPE